MNTYKAAKLFVKAFEDAQKDPVYCLNVGIHDKILMTAWKRLKICVEGKPVKELEPLYQSNNIKQYLKKGKK